MYSTYFFNLSNAPLVVSNSLVGKIALALPLSFLALKVSPSLFLQTPKQNFNILGGLGALTRCCFRLPALSGHSRLQNK